MTDCSFYNGTLDSISALLWYLHTITMYPKGNNVDSIDETIEVQNVESSIGSRMETENDLALRSPLGHMKKPVTCCDLSISGMFNHQMLFP